MSSQKPKSGDALSGSKPAGQASPSLPEGHVVFYCPQGHQLNGPATLQGQPGQCPRCGVKFRIPFCDSPGKGNEDDEILSLADLDPVAPHEQAGAEGWRSDAFHPMEHLFATLWREKEHGGVVEIHVEGLIILPDWWAESLSTDTHGVFAMQVPDGSYVIEAVPWESICRITVRCIKALPDGVFR